MTHASTQTPKSRCITHVSPFAGSTKRERPDGGRTAAGPFKVEEIIDGLRHDEFEPYFQPKVDIRTFEVIGTEALARWRHPRFGVVRPHAFLEPLEKAGEAELLARCMLTKAARFCKTLEGMGRAGTMAVNIGLRSLADPRFTAEIVSAVKSKALDPQRIILDIVYSARTAEVDSTIHNLAHLKAEGFALSIDPYGGGYVAIQRLAVIAFSELKIDQFFVTCAGEHAAAREILASSIEMARRLGIRSVAEGVETRASRNLLAELGCDCAQGHYFAAPMAGRQYLDWLRLRPDVRALVT